MQRKHIILLAVAAALVGLNLWRWFPASSAGSKSTPDEQSTGTITTESLTVLGISDDSRELPVARRNLFLVEAPISTKPVKTPRPMIPRRTEKHLTRTNAAKKAAQAELGAYQLLGVLIRNHSRQAFMLKGDRPYTVQTGDLIDHHIRVEKITAKKVVLQEKKSRVTRTMMLTGE